MRRANRLIVFGAVLALSIVVLSAVGPALVPHDPYETRLEYRLAAPDGSYPLGTDQLGRCVLSRVMTGARLSLSGAVAALFLSLSAGFCAGLAAALGAPWLDGVLMRICDVFLAFPFMILAVILSGVMGASRTSVILSVGLAGWAWWARFVRTMVRSAGERDFVRAGISMGAGRRRLLFTFILPQLLPPLTVAATLNMGKMLVVMSTLGYLGIGVQPPAPDWGNMLKESRMYMAQAPWLVLAPGGAVTMTVMAFGLLGEGLRDIFEIRPQGAW